MFRGLVGIGCSTPEPHGSGHFSLSGVRIAYPVVGFAMGWLSNAYRSGRLAVRECLMNLRCPTMRKAETKANGLWTELA